MTKPLYLHSSWRSSSTYVWAKFRADPKAYCYFEPMAEHLRWADEKVLGGVSWTYANHPPLDAPYRREFLPLLDPKDGIKGFPAEGPHVRYRLEPGDEAPQWVRYFDILSGHARALGRYPVFGMVRSSLRVGWFRAHMDGVHVYIERDPRRQFLSMMLQQSKGTPYFLERWVVILGNNRDDPLLAPLCERIGLPRHDGPGDGRDAYYRWCAGQAEVPVLYAAFYYLHRLAARRLDGACDLVLNVDGIARDEDVRAEAEQGLAALTGVSVSFADCRPEVYDDYLKGDYAHTLFDPIEGDMDRLLSEALGKA